MLGWGWGWGGRGGGRGSGRGLGVRVGIMAFVGGPGEGCGVDRRAVLGSGLCT